MSRFYPKTAFELSRCYDLFGLRFLIHSLGGFCFFRFVFHVYATYPGALI